MHSDSVQVDEKDMNKASDIEKEFSVVEREMALAQFDLVKIIENPVTGHQIYMKQVDCNNHEEFVKQIKFAKRRSKVTIKSINKYFDFTSMNQRHGFSKTVWVRHFFEIPKTYLSQVIQRNPAVSSSIFLTELLYQMIETGVELQKVGLGHGFITPDYISFHEPTKFKLVDNFKYPSSFKMAQLEISERTFKYASPEVYQKVKSKESLDRTNMPKHDVFCLGLLMVDMALGASETQIYNDDGTFNFSVLKTRKEQFKDKFTDGFNSLLAYTVIENMLDYDHATRLDWITLQKRLPPYSDVQRYFKDEYKISSSMSCYQSKNIP
jgi:hypothetical protein